MRETQTMKALCARDNVRAEFAYGMAKRRNDSPHMVNNWRVTLKRKGRTIAVDFFGGSAVENPTAEDVLSSLCLDARAMDDSDFDDMMSGCKPSEVIRTKKLLDDLGPKVRRFLGDAFGVRGTGGAADVAGRVLSLPLGDG